MVNNLMYERARNVINRNSKYDQHSNNVEREFYITNADINDGANFIACI